jgi:uroporphyrinogen decarboxylase
MNWNDFPHPRREPEFQNLLNILNRQAPTRPTLFEFFLNDPLYERLVPGFAASAGDPQKRAEAVIQANYRVGYDFTNILVPNFSFTDQGVRRKRARSVSMDEGSAIHNRSEFQSFPWPDPDQADYEIFTRLKGALPDGMQFIAYGPGGVLENVVELVGYEASCVMIYDDPALAQDIFGEVGSRLVRYYEHAARYESVGACISNDDWGFKTQTMFSPKEMRKYVFPWHKKIVETIHAAGKPAILHSCGHFQRIIEDVIEDMGYDGRHSYEDSILPVETFYEQYHQRIAVLGGIDLDYVCRETPANIYRRSKDMLKRCETRGSFALGTGNSVPDYVPDEHFFAMIQAAFD